MFLTLKTLKLFLVKFLFVLLLTFSEASRNLRVDFKKKVESDLTFLMK